MRSCCDQLGHRVRESGVRAYVKDWEGVFAIIQAASGEDDGDEVDASVIKERSGTGFCEELGEDNWVSRDVRSLTKDEVTYLDVHSRYVAHHVVLVINHCQGCDALEVEE